jgi:acyl-CoA thioester hydrolase
MPVTVKHRVNFYDTDAMAVVHHANYIRWFEIGRVEYLRSIGITLDMLMDDGYVFPITEVRAKYLSPGHFDEELLMEQEKKQGALSTSAAPQGKGEA